MMVYVAATHGFIPVLNFCENTCLLDHISNESIFTGIQLEQLPDFSIRANQGDYIHAIPCIEIGKYRRNQIQEPITESEMTCLRGLIGSLQYATTHTRPDMSAKLGEIQVQLSKPTVSTLLAANKVLREAKETSDVNICFRSIPPKDVTHVVFGDASFASPKQLASFQGTMVFATNPSLQENLKAPISPLSWSSKKISRVVRSTLSAEAFSMSRSVDKMGWCRLLWGTLVVPGFQWRSPPDAFRQLHAAIIVTDCKSLYDLVSRRAMPSCEEYRTTLEVLLIKERCLEHCFLDGYQQLFNWLILLRRIWMPLFFVLPWNRGLFNFSMKLRACRRMPIRSKPSNGYVNHINRVFRECDFSINCLLM